MRRSEKVMLIVLCVMCDSPIFLRLFVRAADKLEPLNVKTGTWEMSYTVNATGQMPFSDERLAQLTPEMRARMEQLWKEQTSNAAQTHTTKRCITEEDLRKFAFADASKSCTLTVLASSSAKLDVREECNTKDGKKTTTYHLQAPTPESVKGDVDQEMTASSRTMKIKGTFTAKWIGSACKDAN